MSHHIEHAKLYTFTIPKMNEYRIALIEIVQTKPNNKALSLSMLIAKILNKPLENNTKLVINGHGIKNVPPESLSYIVHILSSTIIPLYLQSFDPYSQALVSCIDTNKNGEMTLLSSAIVTKKNFKSAGKKPTIFFLVARASDKSISAKTIKHFYKNSWNILVHNLKSYSIMEESTLPQRTFTLLVILKEKRQDNFIEVTVPELHEMIRVRIPIMKASWSLEDVPPKLKHELETVIVRPLVLRASYAPRGILITGPPGIGKSVTAEAIASSLNLKIAELKPSAYRSMWYGLTEKILEAALQNLKFKKNFMILLDDVDFLVGRQIAIHETHVSEITIFLRYLQEPSRPLIVMTTNTPEILDPAIIRPGRIDAVLIMGYPDREFRKYIAIRSAKRYNIKLDEKLAEYISTITRWFTNAEIDALIRLAASKSNGNIDEESILWARQRFNINESLRKSIQEQLRWYSEQFQGVVVKYIANENEIL
ncbi:MAG: ATP-binding protein [Ignisphaera sp.]|nr:ATP-binding protein [Ignisphaera sp.]MCX8168141.1 ATP-binding protein [Ignisphaera sp.]MDW8085219.1 ATP-binding protein [Ignisphaera sp.]